MEISSTFRDTIKTGRPRMITQVTHPTGFEAVTKLFKSKAVLSVWHPQNNTDQCLRKKEDAVPRLLNNEKVPPVAWARRETSNSHDDTLRAEMRFAGSAGPPTHAGRAQESLSGHADGRKSESSLTPLQQPDKPADPP